MEKQPYVSNRIKFLNRQLEVISTQTNQHLHSSVPKSLPHSPQVVSKCLSHKCQSKLLQARDEVGNEDCYYNQDYRETSLDLEGFRLDGNKNLHSRNSLTILFYIRLCQSKSDEVVQILLVSLEHILRR